MRTQSFSTRLLRRFFVVSVLSWGIVLVAGYVQARRHLDEAYRVAAEAQIESVGLSFLEPIKALNYGYIRRQCSHVVLGQQFERLRILDNSGVLIHECEGPGRRSTSSFENWLLATLLLPREVRYEIRGEDRAPWGRAEGTIHRKRAANLARALILPNLFIAGGLSFFWIGIALVLVTREGEVLRSLALWVRGRAERRPTEREPEVPCLVRPTSEVQEIADSIRWFVSRIDELDRKLSFNAKLAGVGEAMGMFAHDARKPLASVEMFLANFDAARSDPELARTILNHVRKAKVDLDRMMEDMLEFGHKRPLRKDRCTLQDLLVSALVDAVRPEHEKKVDIDYDLKHTRLLDVDVVQVKRMMGNILGNAIDAVNDGGRVWTASSDAEGGLPWVDVVIGNTGSFLLEEDRERIFEPFFTKNKKRGTGLGLAIAYKVVEMHGGSIVAESRKEVGTWFRFRLPAGELEQSSESPCLFRSASEVREAQQRGVSGIDNNRWVDQISNSKYPLSILIVDDEALFRRSLRSLVNQVGRIRDKIMIVEASTGEEALDLFERERFDCAIVDVNLGEDRMDGFDFAKRLRERFPSKSVLIHSNLDVQDGEARAKEVGAAGFIQKPMSLPQLLNFLAGACQGMA